MNKISKTTFCYHKNERKPENICFDNAANNKVILGFTTVSSA